MQIKRVPRAVQSIVRCTDDDDEDKAYNASCRNNTEGTDVA